MTIFIGAVIGLVLGVAAGLIIGLMLGYEIGNDGVGRSIDNPPSAGRKEQHGTASE